MPLVQFIVNDKGQKVSVVLSIKEWEDMNEKFEKLQNKLRILTGISEGINEVKQARKTGRKLSTLNRFLDESRG